MKCSRFLCLLLLVLPLGGGCAWNGLDNVPLPAEWYSEQKDFPPDFPVDSFIETNRDLDIAIIGKGFFRCTDPLTDEFMYTRLGHFNINHEGCLVLFFLKKCPNENPSISYSCGYLLEPRITVPPNTDKIQIDESGMVWIVQNGDVRQLQLIGQLELATFAHPEGLLQIEENLYCETEASGPATISTPGLDGTGLVKSQYLEVLTPSKREVATR